ncbi:MAG: cytochrome c, partial [Melioribacter sp.]|nr:cytochrome c [Melioribacter sp.]
MEKKYKIEEEINFKELLKSPIRLFGWIFPIYLLLILILGIYFALHLNRISFNEKTIGITDTTNIKKDIVEKKGMIITPVDFESIKNPTKEMLSKGKELYDINCKSCHGEQGMGDGPAGLSMNPKPRNLHSKEGWTNGRTIDAMYKTLHEGIIKNGMPAFEYINPNDRFNIILYIRTLADFPEITNNQLNELKLTYKLDQNLILPNQIPVEKAEMLIANENKIFIDKLSKMKGLLITSDELGARLIKDNSYDIEKVLYTFITLKERTFDLYIKIVTQEPLLIGYKPSIVRLDREK